MRLAKAWRRPAARAGPDCVVHPHDVVDVTARRDGLQGVQTARLLPTTRRESTAAGL